MKNFSFYLLIISVFFFWSCDEKSECKSMLIKDCVNTKEYNPVCGCDGVTYGNPGEAACNSIEEYTQGACNAVKDSSSSCGNAVIIDVKKYESLEQQYLGVDSVSLEGTCLTVYATHSGCDDNLTYELVTNGFVMESYPPQQSLKLGLVNDQLCEAVISTQQVFDLSELIGSYDKMYFNLDGHIRSIYYEE